jgi:hypothetical protein
VPYGRGYADGNAVGTGGPRILRANEQEKAAGIFFARKIQLSCADGNAVGIAAAVR